MLSQKSPIPLSADGLGAQLLLTVSEEIGEISRDVADMARTLTHFPAFYYWIVRTANDPAAYNLLIEIAWKLALVLGSMTTSDVPTGRVMAPVGQPIMQTGSVHS